MSIEAFRTPEERFADLPGFPWEPRYLEWEGLRLARIDEGPAERGEGASAPIVLLHGEPTWSFLYRKVLPPLLADGHRCIAPDLPGFGRSDKPTDIGWYTYDHHCEALAFVLAELGVEGATFVLHDWGGPIGFRVAAEHPELCSRLVVMDTGIFTGRQQMTSAWKAFRDFVERTEDLPIGMLVSGACASEPSAEVIAGYEAPFPGPASKAGARAFPLILPTSPEDPGAAAGESAADAIASADRPSLCLWADSDPIIPIESGRNVAERLGLTAPEPIEGASHFLQEDQGAVIGERIAAWLR